jgi:hypothetical protein
MAVIDPTRLPQNEVFLFRYTYPCTLGNETRFEELKKRFPDLRGMGAVRAYFLGPHNQQAFERKVPMALVHMAIPYDITPLGIAYSAKVIKGFFELPEFLGERLFTRGDVNKARELGLLSDIMDICFDDIIISHNGYMVDMIKEEVLREILSG